MCLEHTANGVVGFGTGVPLFQSVGNDRYNSLNTKSGLIPVRKRDCVLSVPFTCLRGKNRHVNIQWAGVAFTDTGSLGPSFRDTVDRVSPSGRPHLHRPCLPFNERSVGCPLENRALTAETERFTVVRGHCCADSHS